MDVVFLNLVPLLLGVVCLTWGVGLFILCEADYKISVAIKRHVGAPLLYVGAVALLVIIVLAILQRR